MLSELKRTNDFLSEQIKSTSHLFGEIEESVTTLKQVLLMERGRRERAQIWFANFRTQLPGFAFEDVFPKDKSVLVVRDDDKERLVEELDAVSKEKLEYAEMPARIRGPREGRSEATGNE